MKPLSFRQWTVCTAMVAVLFNASMPLAVCRCEGCPCSNSAARQTNFVPVEKKCRCCCEAPIAAQDKTSPGHNCCGTSDTPCCCCSTSQDRAIIPGTAPLIPKPNFGAVWNSTALLRSTQTQVVASRMYPFRTLPPPHVPLHVFLCVFLN